MSRLQKNLHRIFNGREFKMYYNTPWQWVEGNPENITVNVCDQCHDYIVRVSEFHMSIGDRWIKYHSKKTGHQMFYRKYPGTPEHTRIINVVAGSVTNGDYIWGKHYSFSEREPQIVLDIFNQAQAKLGKKSDV